MLHSLPWELPPSLFPLAVLLSSLFGSWHCAGMCGPIACSAGLQGYSHSYHFGRLVSYTLLGTLAGILGQSVLSEQLLPFRYAAAFMMGFLLLSLGVSFFFSWNWSNLLFHKFGFNTMRPLRRFLHERSEQKDWREPKDWHEQKFLLGFFTALLPCGWLYSFVLVAVTTKSWWLGAATMLIFWTGTVPALLLVSAGFRRMAAAPPMKVRKILGVFFMFAGVYSLVQQVWLSHFLR